MKRLVYFVFILLVCPFAKAQVPVTLIQDNWEAGPETGIDIALSRKDPANVVAVIADGIVHASLDSGKTWTLSELKPEGGVLHWPQIVSDKKGNFLLAGVGHSENTGSRLYFYRSTDKGRTWEGPESVSINDDSKFYQLHLHYDKSNDLHYSVWTSISPESSNPEKMSSNIFFSSSSGGKKWSSPIQINRQSGEGVVDNPASSAVQISSDPEGRLFLTYLQNGQMLFDRSFDKGKTWLKNDLDVIKEGAMWNFSGSLSASSIPTFDIDRSRSVFGGTLYLVWTQKDNKGNLQLSLKKSNRNGDSWTSGDRIATADSVASQFTPVMSVDEGNGIFYMAFFSTDSSNNAYAWLNASVDSGKSMLKLPLSSEPFPWEKALSLGNFITIDSYRGNVAVAWTEMDVNGQANVKVSVINYGRLTEK